jgi:hypothetical protein
MPGLVPGIHVFLCFKQIKTWMAETSPAMTWKGVRARALMRLFPVVGGVGVDVERDG